MKFKKKLIAWFKIIVIPFYLFVVSTSMADELFRYNFSENDTLNYSINIVSKIKFGEFENLARLLNIDNMTHSLNMDVVLVTESIFSDNSAVVKAVFRKISLVIITGDKVSTDDGSNWGSIKPGSEYSFVITPEGEITDFYGPDTIMTRQGIQMIQRFFPVFPESAVSEGFSWNDSVILEIEMPGKEPVEILSQMTYLYDGKGSYENIDVHNFEFTSNGIAADSSVELSGQGLFNFNKVRGRIVNNSADFLINASVDPSAFGFPVKIKSGIPINLESKVEVRLYDGR